MTLDQIQFTEKVLNNALKSFSRMEERSLNLASKNTRFYLSCCINQKNNSPSKGGELLIIVSITVEQNKLNKISLFILNIICSILEEDNFCILIRNRYYE